MIQQSEKHESAENVLFLSIHLIPQAHSLYFQNSISKCIAQLFNFFFPLEEVEGKHFKQYKNWKDSSILEVPVNY